LHFFLWDVECGRLVSSLHARICLRHKHQTNKLETNGLGGKKKMGAGFFVPTTVSLKD